MGDNDTFETMEGPTQKGFLDTLRRIERICRKWAAKTLRDAGLPAAVVVAYLEGNPRHCRRASKLPVEGELKRSSVLHWHGKGEHTRKTCGWALPVDSPELVVTIDTYVRDILGREGHVLNAARMIVKSHDLLAELPSIEHKIDKENLSALLWAWYEALALAALAEKIPLHGLPPLGKPEFPNQADLDRVTKLAESRLEEARSLLDLSLRSNVTEENQREVAAQNSLEGAVRNARQAIHIARYGNLVGAWENLYFSEFWYRHAMEQLLGAIADRGMNDHNQKSDAGKKKKRRAWAETLAEQVADFSLTQEQVWLTVPEADAAVDIQDSSGCWEVYRDGSKLVAITPSGRETEMTQGSFFKRYYPKKKK